LRRSNGLDRNWSRPSLLSRPREASSRNETPAGTFVDIVPDREVIARYGLTMRDVQDVIEAAIGGMPIEVTVEGRARFSVNVRYPRDLRQNVERLKEVLVPLPVAAGAQPSTSLE